jgi:hypothetical protein
MPQVITSDFSYAPLFVEPRLQFVFFNVRLTLSCEIVSMTANCPSLSAIIWRVQRPYPSGGSLHATMVTWASTLVSIFMGRPLRGASWSTSSMCSYSFCIYFFRTLYMVPRDTPHMVVSSVTGLASSKRSKTRARLMARALFFPWATNFSKTSRAAVVNRTARRFSGILHSSLQRRVYRKRLPVQRLL